MKRKEAQAETDVTVGDEKARREAGGKQARGDCDRDDGEYREGQDAGDWETDDDGSSSAGMFEDAWEDEFSDEDIIESDEVEAMELGNLDVSGRDGAEEGEMLGEGSGEGLKGREPREETYLPGQALAEGEVLDYDSGAYEMLHQMNVEWPCLSFDILPQASNTSRNTGEKLQYPLSCTLLAGTQADASKRSDNTVFVMRVESLGKTQHDSDSEDSDSDDSDVEDDPVVHVRELKVPYGINRIRALDGCDSYRGANAAGSTCNLAASINDDGSLGVYSLDLALRSLDSPADHPRHLGPQFLARLPSHSSEGYALAWDPNTPAQSTPRFLSGDVTGAILETRIDDQGRGAATSAKPVGRHDGSVEDLQWSPTEPQVFSSCSTDGTYYEVV